MAHVLIATDFSAHALNAAIYGVKLFGIEGNSFTLLTTYQTLPSSADAPPPFPDGTAQAMTEALEAFAQGLLERMPEYQFDLATVCAYGALDTVLRDMAGDEQRPDVVVMGTHGSDGLERVFMGSTAATVIRNVPLPVIAVPIEAVYRDPRRIILADDGGPVERATLGVLLDIARWSRAEVKIVHVVSEHVVQQEEANNSGYDLELGAIPHTYHSVSGDNVMIALSNMADQSDADLTVVIHRQRDLLDRLFHGSVSIRMALHTSIPLLVLQHTAAR